MPARWGLQACLRRRILGEYRRAHAAAARVESKDSAVLPGGRLRAASRHGAVPARGLRQEDNRGKQTLAGFTEPNSHQWYAKAGVRRQWLPPGHTVLFAECGQYIDQLSPNALAAGLTSSEFTRFGLAPCRRSTRRPCRYGSSIREHSADVTGVGLGLTGRLPLCFRRGADQLLSRLVKLPFGRAQPRCTLRSNSGSLRRSRVRSGTSVASGQPRG